MKLGYIAIDQYGASVKIKSHPRKELLEHYGAKHSDRMYIDLKSGGSQHIGYIIRGHWFRVYEVHNWGKKR